MSNGINLSFVEVGTYPPVPDLMTKLKFSTGGLGRKIMMYLSYNKMSDEDKQWNDHHDLFLKYAKGHAAQLVKYEPDKAIQYIRDLEDELLMLADVVPSSEKLGYRQILTALKYTVSDDVVETFNRVVTPVYDEEETWRVEQEWDDELAAEWTAEQEAKKGKEDQTC